jgi:hypothetical protein
MSLRPRSPSCRASGLALAAVLACGGLAAASPAAVPAGPPPRLAPLPPDLAKPLPDLEHAAEEYRGIAFRRPVPAGVLTGAALRREVDRQMAEEMAPGTLAALGAALKAFGLVPESLDLGTYYPSLLSSQIAAFYDPERKYLAVVDLGPQEDAAVTRALGAAFAARARQAVLVHELTHALQDQAFDMTRFESTDPLSDASTGRLALVEGDATEVMMDFLMGAKIESLPGAADLLGPMLKDDGAGSPGGSGFPGSREIAAAPAFFRDSLLFSYLHGFAFCVAVRQRGGQKLLDYAFAQDPPRSSEQVLHPEKWYGRRDDPQAIALPDLAAVLPGARKVAEGELGEEGIRILLAGPLGGTDAASAAAAGWGGDRFAVYQREGERSGGPGGRLLAWVTEWDTDADAATFLAAAGRLGAGWTVRRTAPTRVVVTRGPYIGSQAGGEAGGEQEAVMARLAAAKAEKPANRPIDLAALGIPAAASAPADTPAKPPQPSPRPADGARALPHLKGRRYTNPEPGFAVELPATGGPWRLGPGSAAGVPLQAKSADGAVVLEVLVRDLAVSSASPRELGEAMAKKVADGGGRVLRAGLATGNAYDLEVEKELAGRTVREWRRLHVRGSRLFEAAGTAPVESWAARAAEVATFLDSFAPTSLPAAPSPGS